MYAHGVENRFSDWSLDRVFGDLRRFVIAAQWQQFRALKYQIEAMRRKPTLAGYVITELHDCHWESNGLLDMRRNPRVFHELFRIINADTVIVPQWERAVLLGRRDREARGRRSRTAPARCSRDAQLEVSLGEAHAAICRCRASRRRPCSISARSSSPMPDSREAGLRRIAFEICARRTARWSRRTISISRSTRAARRPAQARQLVWAHGRGPARAVRGPRLWRSARALEEATLVVSRQPRQGDRRPCPRRGASLLLLPENEMTLYPFFPHWQAVRVQSRDGTLWRGDWASSFSWLRRAGPFRALPERAAPRRDHGPGPARLRDLGLQPPRLPGPGLRRPRRRLDPQAGGARRRALLRPRPPRRFDLPAVPGRAPRRPDRDHAGRQSRRARPRSPRRRGWRRPCGRRKRRPEQTERRLAPAASER